jgi:1-acyl-sn-glycerol-3-phosphate acyltransferase
MVITLRSLAFIIFFAISSVLYAIPISILRRIAPFSIIARMGKHWGLVNLRALEIICGLGYRVQGMENLPDRSSIVLCKHQSTWETIALRALLPPENTWVVKRELLFIPFFGWALAAFQPISLNRSSARQSIRKLLDEGTYWLDRGRSLVIFPEGTRVSPGETKRYGQGGAMIAQKTGCPVVPIAHNAGIFWGRRDIKKYPGKIDLVIGKPIDPNGLTSGEINRRIQLWIEVTVGNLPNKRVN